MIHLLLVIAFLGFIAYIVTLIPMPPIFKQVITAIVIFFLVVVVIEFAASLLGLGGGNLLTF